jgi:hypothetical protein
MKVENIPYGKVTSGERAGSGSAVALPDVDARLIWISAVSSNVGDVYVGGSGVTVVNGTTDTTSGYELNPGDKLGPLPLGNLNLLYIICDNAGDDITYLVLN